MLCISLRKPESPSKYESNFIKHILRFYSAIVESDRWFHNSDNIAHLAASAIKTPPDLGRKV